MDEAKKHHFGDKVTYCKKNYHAIDGADAVLVLTEWNEFRHPDFDRIKSLLKKPVIFDGRNCYVGYGLPAKGFDYTCVGVPKSKAKA